MIIVGWGGEPATGKSTIMKRLMTRFKEEPVPRKYDTLQYLDYEQSRNIILGRYPDGQAFGGTDRLPMNVQPFAEKFLAQRKSEDYTVWFEGDRLFNAKFLHYIESLSILHHFFAVCARSEVIDQRHSSRDHQNEAWLKGRRTKVKHLINEFDLPTLFSNSEQDIDLVVDYAVRLHDRIAEKALGDITWN